MATRHRIATPTMQGIGFIAVIKSLMTAAYTARELSEITGLQMNTIGRYLLMLHRARLVRIYGYPTDSEGRTSPKLKQWIWGAGPDAVYVKPTRHERYLREKEKRANHTTTKQMLMASYVMGGFAAPQKPGVRGGK